LASSSTTSNAVAGMSIDRIGAVVEMCLSSYETMLSLPDRFLLEIDQEQQADVTAMMLNNELLMIEEALISLGQTSSQSSQWLQQLQLLDRTLCNAEPIQQVLSI
jgi:hypothetical protein